MGCCEDNKIKNRCTSKVPSLCVHYNKPVPEWSELHEEKCVTISETTEDLYKEVGEIKEELDFSKFHKCLEYEQEDTAKLKLKEILKRHQEVLCELTGKDGSNGKDNSIDISRWNLDYKCLVDVCGNPPSTLKQLLQLLIDSICGGGLSVLGFEDIKPVTANSEEKEAEVDPPVIEKIDFTPKFQDTGIKGCSEDDREYRPSIQGEFGFRQQVDVNINSDSYQSVRWVRDIENDNICKK